MIRAGISSRPRFPRRGPSADRRWPRAAGISSGRAGDDHVDQTAQEVEGRWFPLRRRVPGARRARRYGRGYGARCDFDGPHFGARGLVATASDAPEPVVDDARLAALPTTERASSMASLARTSVSAHDEHARHCVRTSERKTCVSRVTCWRGIRAALLLRRRAASGLFSRGRRCDPRWRTSHAHSREPRARRRRPSQPWPVQACAPTPGPRAVPTDFSTCAFHAPAVARKCSASSASRREE